MYEITALFGRWIYLNDPVIWAVVRRKNVLESQRGYECLILTVKVTAANAFLKNFRIVYNYILFLK